MLEKHQSMSHSPTPIVFLAAQKDWELLDQLAKHLSPLEQAEQIVIWKENGIPVGENRKQITQAAIQAADFIFPLLSADFLATESMDGWKKSLIEEQLLDTKTKVIPLILRECMWTYSIFGEIEVLPRNGKSIVAQNKDKTDPSFATIAQEIALLIEAKKIVKPTPNVLIRNNIFTDPRDGQSYPTIAFLGKTWMTKNLNFALEEGYRCYDDNPENGKVYGGLYSWPAAQKACPPGWHLSTAEEWKMLLNYFSNEQLAYKHLLSTGDSPLNFLPAGKWSTHQSACIYLGKTGFYWTNQEVNYAQAIYYMFDEGMAALRRIAVDKKTGASCRCVLD